MTRGSTRVAMLLTAALASGAAEAGIEKLESCGLNWGSGVVGLARGVYNDVTVTGFGVDLATSVDSTLSNTSITVTSRKNGFGSNIVVRIVPPAVGDRIVGAKVNLHYFGGGVDTFNVNVSAGPKVTSIAFAPGSGVTTSGGTTRVTSLDPHVVILKGSNLDGVRLNDSETERGAILQAQIVLQLAGELRISFTSAAGERAISAALFEVASGLCGHMLPEFSLGFTVYDPPRTPTPTTTPTATRTPTAPPFNPLRIAPGVPTSFPPTPTPTPKGGATSPLSPKK